MELSAAQIRAARALLDWTGPKLAEAAGVALSTVRRAEEGKTSAVPVVKAAIKAALESAGVEFMPGGAKLKGVAE